MDELVRTGQYSEYRQIACVDRDGRSAAWTGEKALPLHATVTADDVATAGNLLTAEHVVEAMADEFLRRGGAHIGDRLIAALRAGYAAGGEAGHQERSAGLIVCDREPYPIADLRIDWDESNPVDALHGLWARFAPQIGVFLRRANRPDTV